MTGLLSVTYRQLSPEEIIKLAVECGLECVEWGSDIHVPSGDTETAKRVAKLSADAGIKCPTYGSYYKIAVSEKDDFAKVVECAKILGSKCIRVWTYDKKMCDASESELENAVADAQRICDMASDFKICLECHDGTLTDDYNDTLKFIKLVNRPNLRMFWQPNQYKTEEYNLECAKALASYTENVHVFAWKVYDRFPLKDHEKIWRKYIEILRSANNDMPFMLEFTPHDDPSEIYTETETLKEWLK